MDPDRPLIESLSKGDDSALNELIQRHQRALFHFTLRYLHNEANAQDVVQEAFVRVYFNAEKFTAKSSVKTWLFTIALNLCRDQHRREKRRHSAWSFNAPPSENSAGMEAVDQSPIPSTRAGEADRFAQLQHAIDQLPVKLREALILFSLEQRSQRETAELLGVTPKTIELRVYHAKQKLRSALSNLV